MNIFLGREEIVKYNKINIFQKAFDLLAIIIFLLIFKQNVFGAVLSYILTIIVVSIVVSIVYFNIII